MSMFDSWVFFSAYLWCCLMVLSYEYFIRWNWCIIILRISAPMRYQISLHSCIKKIVCMSIFQKLVYSLMSLLHQNRYKTCARVWIKKYVLYLKSYLPIILGQLRIKQTKSAYKNRFFFCWFTCMFVCHVFVCVLCVLCTD